MNGNRERPQIVIARFLFRRISVSNEMVDYKATTVIFLILKIAPDCMTYVRCFAQI